MNGYKWIPCFNNNNTLTIQYNFHDELNVGVPNYAKNKIYIEIIYCMKIFKHVDEFKSRVELILHFLHLFVVVVVVAVIRNPFFF